MDQTITQDKTLKWQVLNIDKENKTIDIVSAVPTSNIVYFGGALGYNNGVYLLNDMCEKLYSNTSKGIKARSINLEDMEKHLTDAGFTARNGFSDIVAYGKTKTYTSEKQYPCAYGSQLGAGINITSITQPNIIKTVDPYKESERIYPTPTVLTSDTAGSNGLIVTQTYYGIEINEANYGAAAAILANSEYYWVASRCAYVRSSNVGFGLRSAHTSMYGYLIFYSSGGSDKRSRCLRPYASLKYSSLTGKKDSTGAWMTK